MIPYLTAKVMVEGISLTYKREKYLFGEGVSTIYLNNNEGVPIYRGLWAYL